jgi:hypothetical protein
MVVDARMVEKTRNAEIERKVAASKKILITVINKADLADKAELEKYKKQLDPCVFVSAQKFYGITMLRHLILEKSKGEAVTVGVVGYPNTGKSSVINALRGKASAGVSSVSGYTKGKQDIKVDSKILVIDTPGVLAHDDLKSSDQLVITASRTNVKDPEMAVYELIRQYKLELMFHYDIEGFFEDEEAVLEAIAKKLNRRISGGHLDTETTAKMILQDWQRGKIQL